MAQGLLSSRKRSRDNCGSDSSDFMPLPKRVNSTHFDENVYNNLVSQHVTHASFEGEEWNGLQCQGSSRHAMAQSPDYSCVANQSKNDNAVINPNTEQLHNGYSNLTPASPNQQHPWMSTQILSQYTPDLTAADNPYYYENNKLLFALYMERVQRGGTPFY